MSRKSLYVGLALGAIVVGFFAVAAYLDIRREARMLPVPETSALVPMPILPSDAKVKFDDLLPTSEVSSVRHTDDGAIVLSVEKLYIWDPIVCDGVLDFQLRRPTSDEPTTETAALDAPEVLYE